MRVFVLALAILLLPLRGWLGDAMAIEAMPSSAALHATHTMAAGEHAMHGSHDASAHDTPQASHHAQAADHAPASPDCQSTCSDCQLCHSVAMTLWPTTAAPVAAPRAAPARAPAAFASAEPAPGFKPPIS